MASRFNFNQKTIMITCCTPTVAVNVPGAPGTNGTNGADGAPGANAFTVTAANITLPAVGSNVVITPLFANTSWMTINQVLVINDGTTTGNFQVVDIPTGTSADLKFLGYPGDGSPGGSINSGAKVSPGGLQGPSAVISVTEITSSAAFAPDANAKFLFVECIGGGGSGGGVGTAATNSGAGGGGGGGAYSSKFFSTPAASYTVTIGAGGAAPAAGSNPGNAGADTVFTDGSNTCTAKGGAGGGADTIAAGPRIAGAGGVGGSSSSGVGDFLCDGNPGGFGLSLAAAQAASGNGGSGPLGGGAIGLKTQNNGNNGGNFGGGGSGGCALSGGASVAGGAGSNGIVRIWQFT